MAQKSVTFYVIKGNSDQTEGRGGSVDRQVYHDAEVASKAIQSDEVNRRWGVMGTPSGLDMVQRIFTFNPDGTVSVEEFKLWGYRKDLTGKWGYGWTDNRDAPIDNPEFREYLRLKTKFEGEAHA